MKTYIELLNEDVDLIKSFAEKSGKSKKEVEALWKELVASTKKAHPNLTEKDNRFWEIVTGTLKKILKIKSEKT
jgi:hypothetical protein